MYHCPICRTAHAEGTVYCSNCGARVDTAAVPPSVSGSSAAPGQRSPTAPLWGPQEPPPALVPPQADAAHPTASQPQYPRFEAQSGSGWQQPPAAAPTPPQPQSAAGWQQPPAAAPTPPQPQPGYGQPQPWASGPAPHPAADRQPRRRNWPLIAVIMGVFLLLGSTLAAVFWPQLNPNQPARVSSINAPTRTPRPTRTPEPAVLVEPTQESEPTQAVEPTALAGVQPLAETSGDLIYYSYDEDSLVSIPAAGGTETVLDIPYAAAFTYGEAAWSPDGTRMIIADRERNGAVLLSGDRDGSNLEQFATIEAGMPYWLYWSPDSSKLAFVITDADDEDYSEQNIYVVDIASRTVNQITSDGSVDTTLAWSPDSNRLAYNKYDSEDPYRTQLHVIGADGSNDQTFDGATLFAMDWLSPSVLIFEDDCDSLSGTLCGLDLNSGDKSQVIELTSQTSFSGLSPDKRWVMIEDYDQGSAYIHDLTNGSQEIIAENIDYITWEGWSPDGRFVLYTDFDNYVTYAYAVGSNASAMPLMEHEYVTWLPAR